MSQAKLERFRKIETDEITDSLGPGQPEALKTRLDGTVLEGHHRLVVLRERGVKIDNLPREVLSHEPGGKVLCE